MILSLFLFDNMIKALIHFYFKNVSGLFWLIGRGCLESQKLIQCVDVKVAATPAGTARAEDPAGARKRATKRLRPCPWKASATETKFNRTYFFNNKILEVVLLGHPLPNA
jgi:hypothetical protein